MLLEHITKPPGIDGAGFWTKTFRITIPSFAMYHLMLVNLITGSLQMMDVPYMITQVVNEYDPNTVISYLIRSGIQRDHKALLLWITDRDVNYYHH